jgi:hypothetical protein
VNCEAKGGGCHIWTSLCLRNIWLECMNAGDARGLFSSRSSDNPILSNSMMPSEAEDATRDNILSVWASGVEESTRLLNFVETAISASAPI